MYAAPFEYHAPGSLDEVLSLLREHGDDAKLLAGGHSLIPVMKLRFAQPKHLVDLRKVPGLVGIREEEGALVVGAMTTYAAVQGSELVDRKLPVLAETVRVIGDPLVRNMGTVGGSLAHADPGADLPALALALDADALQALDIADVDDRAGCGQAELHQRQQAVAAGHDLDVAVALAEELERLVEAGRGVVVELGRKHR